MTWTNSIWRLYRNTWKQVSYTSCPDSTTANKEQKVLDIGTGTGLWAMYVLPCLASLLPPLTDSDFADEHPEPDIIGTDLSPSQPTWVPPNVKL